MSLLRNFTTVGGATGASRILGFVRDMLIAGVLGAGPIADAFFVAQRLPNLFRRLFAEGAFGSAFVPLFAKAHENEGAGGEPPVRRGGAGRARRDAAVVTVVAESAWCG
jgi:putative peptidoglycan lipid II flippase